jgi:hypothetical protein
VRFLSPRGRADAAASDDGRPRTPDETKTPIVTGISCRAMRLSKTTGALHATASWHTKRQAGCSGVYWAGR